MRLSYPQSFAAIAVVAIALSVPAGAAQQETEQFERTVPFPSGGRLELHNFSGDVHITGTTGNELVIKAVRRARRDRLDHVRIDVQSSASGASIEANKRDPGWTGRDDNVVETTFEIQVPATARLEIEVFSSDLDIRGVRGPLTLKTFSGEITVDATAAGPSPDLTAHTFSGDIRARLADDVKASVRFDTFSGSLDTSLPLAVRSMGRRTTSGTLAGGGDSTLDFHTFSGNVRIEK